MSRFYKGSNWWSWADDTIAAVAAGILPDFSKKFSNATAMDLLLETLPTHGGRYVPSKSSRYTKSRIAEARLTPAITSDLHWKRELKLQSNQKLEAVMPEAEPLLFRDPRIPAHLPVLNGVMFRRERSDSGVHRLEKIFGSEPEVKYPMDSSVPSLFPAIRTVDPTQDRQRSGRNSGLQTIEEELELKVNARRARAKRAAERFSAESLLLNYMTLLPGDRPISYQRHPPLRKNDVRLEMLDEVVRLTRASTIGTTEASDSWLETSSDGDQSIQEDSLGFGSDSLDYDESTTSSSSHEPEQKSEGGQEGEDVKTVTSHDQKDPTSPTLKKECQDPSESSTDLATRNDQGTGLAKSKKFRTWLVFSVTLIHILLIWLTTTVVFE